jgi:hypothetical protein
MRKLGYFVSLALVTWAGGLLHAETALEPPEPERMEAGAAREVKSPELTFQGWRASGALSFNYRNIGAKPIEIEIENQILLTDIFFRVEGPVLEKTPFQLEFELDPEGQPQIYRMAVRTWRVRRVDLEIGRFLVPFGRSNELYRPDLYPLVSRSLLYASPTGLDFVSRVGYPHPVFSSGYTDTGLRATYLPHAEPFWFPREVTVFLVNGLQESPLVGRPPPEARTFLILDSVSGSDVDWGHEKNFLGDNNDTKNPGARISWDYGDVAYPSPFSRAAILNGFSLTVSGMIGKYDIEDRLSNSVWGADLGLRHREYRLTGEYIWGEAQAKWPLLNTSTDTIQIGRHLLPSKPIKDRYRTSGYTVQLEFPFARLPFSRQNRVVLRRESLTRFGPEVNRLGELIPFSYTKTTINKFSGGFNSRISPYFSVKMEYGLWTFDRFPSIYQTMWAGVLSF